MILTLRTDKPDAEIGLFDGEGKLAYLVWPAHRQLAETVHVKIDEVLKSQDKNLNDISGIVVFKGPGSFTGLRIGLSVANALADSLKVPIIGLEGEELWLEKGLKALNSGQDDGIIMPEYGAPVHITAPNK